MIAFITARSGWLRSSALALVAAGALSSTTAYAIDVANQTDWDNAVASVAAAGAGSVVDINITNGFTLASSLTPLQANNAGVTVNITGNSQTIDGAAAFQGIQIDGANSPNVNISALAIANTAAKGGNGAAGQAGFLSAGLSYGAGGGGGGGLGAGGGLFVGSGANVTITSVVFTGNSATGGAGGAGGIAQNVASSPTGGNGGDGGALNGGGATGGGGVGGTGGNTGTQGTVGTPGASFGAGGGGGGGSGTTNSTTYTSNNGGGNGNNGGGQGNAGGDGVTNNGGSGGPGADGGSGGAGGGARGGAVFVASGGTLTILDTSISGATVTSGAGGIQGVGMGPSNFNGAAGPVGAASGAGLYLDAVKATIGVSTGTVTYDNTIGGTGLSIGGVATAIEKTGAGTLTLGATNTFVGNVVVNAGVLSIANPLNLGNNANDILLANGTTLAVTGTSTFGAGHEFKIAGSGTFDIASGTTSVIQGVVSNNGATGSLTKTNSGTLVLSGTNTYSGPTTITGGTLRLGSAGAVGLSAGRLVSVGSGATFDANGFNLTIGGTLVNNGTVTNATTTIANGGLIGGNGSIGALTIASGGTLAPGNSIGELKVTGPLIVALGSNYAVEVAPDGTSDNTAVTGSVTLQGGTVTVTSSSAVGAFPLTPSTYTILTATTGVTGSFATVDTSALAFFNGALDYANPNSVRLVLTRNDVGFSSVGTTPNQIAAANGANSLGSGNPLFGAISAMSARQAAATFDQISGDGFATANGQMMQSSTTVRNAISDRIQQAFSSIPSMSPNSYVASSDPVAERNSSVWASGYGQWQSHATDENAGASTTTSGGGFAGFDGVLGGARLGALLGYGQTGVVVADRGTRVASQDFSAAAYMGTEFETIQLAMGASYTRHLFTSTRNITSPSVQTLSADYQGGTTQAFVEASKDFDVGTMTLTPFGSLALVNVDTDGFTEGGGNAALTVAASNNTSAMTSIGLRTGTSFILGEDLLVRVTAGIGWQHSFADTPVTSNSFAGGTPFTVAGLPTVADAARVQLGFDVDASEALSLRANYDGTFNSSSQAHRVSLEIAGKF